MKKINLIMISTVFLLAITKLSGQPKITFIQGDKLNLKTDGDLQTIKIKPNAFTIRFEAEELHVCTGLDEDLYQFAKPEIDINQDFNSSFFIFKYLAMSEDADYLPVGKDVAASLNKTHGAKPVDGQHNEFKVVALQVDDKLKKLKQLDEFYMALWLDDNKDQFIDADEYLKVKVVVSK